MSDTCFYLETFLLYNFAGKPEDYNGLNGRNHLV